MLAAGINAASKRTSARSRWQLVDETIPLQGVRGKGRVDRNAIIAWTAQHGVPAIYARREFVLDGALVAYATNTGTPPLMWIEFCAASGRAICQCSSRPSSSS